MKNIFVALLLFVTTIVGAQVNRTQIQFGDDTWVNVPLQFPFPFYGRTFTNSFMFSNGAVAFMSIGAQPTDSYCCSGIPVNNQMPISFHYTIMPMQTDLYPVQQSRFYIQGDATYQKYWWENIAEISNTNNLNTFSVEIKPTGYIGIKYDQVNIQNQFVTSAIIGDASRGEYTLHYHGQGMNASSVPGLIEYGSTGNICNSNPLADPSCPGYAEAYFTQQCSANPLYAVNCPGYQQAYFNQQCTANPLYNSGCPGYQQAYFNQQCSLNALYNNECPGYAEAYFAQQCQANGLYSTQCPNYSTAYATSQLLNRQSAPSSALTTTTTEPVVTAQVVTDTNVNNAITTPSTTSATSVTPGSPVSVINPQPVTQNTIQQAAQPAATSQTQVAAQQEQKQDQNRNEQRVANTVERRMEPGARNNRQAARDAVAKVQKEIAKESQEATTMEAQVATQGLVLGSMNFVPGFDAYRNAIIPDTNGLLMARQYQKPVIDNQRAQRRLSGANESRWQEMVDSQYQLGR